MSFQKMYGFEGLGLSEVQLSISELSVVGGWWTRQTHFMVGPSQGPTKRTLNGHFPALQKLTHIYIEDL